MRRVVNMLKQNKLNADFKNSKEISNLEAEMKSKNDTSPRGAKLKKLIWMSLINLTLFGTRKCKSSIKKLPNSGIKLSKGTRKS